MACEAILLGIPQLAWALDRPLMPAMEPGLLTEGSREAAISRIRVHGAPTGLAAGGRCMHASG